ncbi:hypothetical protein C8Q77DRAFT_1037878, partial [Trametes polyzona]
YPSSARRPSVHSRAIRVVIPSEATPASVATPADTPGHGHPASASAAPVPAPAALFAIASTPVTPGHGHPALASISPAYQSPATPTSLRMSARASRRSGWFSTSAAAIGEEDEEEESEGHLLSGSMTALMDEDAEHE